MAVHKLILDHAFDEDLYALIAIHCTLEDYRVAYLLNKYLNITLTRRPADIDNQNGTTSYSIFEWEDSKQLTNWSLVSNVCKTEDYRITNYESLFNDQEKITKTSYLIPEYKFVNYFLKIENELSTSKEQFFVKRILQVPQIVTAYGIDYNQLKSKDNLIF